MRIKFASIDCNVLWCANTVHHSSVGICVGFKCRLLNVKLEYESGERKKEKKNINEQITHKQFYIEKR